MTDDFNSRYRLLKVVALDQGIRSHNAQELTTGRVVMVHLVDDAGPERVRQLLDAIGRLADPDRARVLETATLAAGFAIVTDFLSPMRSFADWLTSRAPEVTQSMELPVPDFQPATLQDVPSLQITDRVTPPKPVSRVVTQPVAPPLSVPPPVAVSPPAFTSSVPAAPPVAVPPAPMAAAPDAALPEPGEFTRLFKVGGAPPAAPVAPPQPAPVASMPATIAPPPTAVPELPPLMPPVVASATPTPTPAAPPPMMPPPVAAPTAPPQSGPGEFTQMFSPAARQPSAPPPPAQPVSAPPPMPVMTPPAMAAPSPPAPAPHFPPTPVAHFTPSPPVTATPPKAPPGAFTQMFSAPSSSSSPSSHAAQPTPLLDPFRGQTHAPPNAAAPSVPFGSGGGSPFPPAPASPPPALNFPPPPAASAPPINFPPAPSAPSSWPPPPMSSGAPPISPASPPMSTGAPPLSAGVPPLLQPPVFDDKLAQLGSLDPLKRAAAAPSEYTQMIRGAPPAGPKAGGAHASASAAPKTAQPAAAAPATAPAKKFPAMLLVIINAVLFVLMATILWVVFGRKPATPTVQPPAVTAPALPNPPVVAPPR